MSSAAWWNAPYKGGPMVAVKGFPRPLYPPDSDKYGKGKGSVTGSDVEAYKRTVSRAGRWVWQQFDQTYSNGFAHGKGPNVTDTGVAGVQRQQSIDPTGYIGQQTFNTLRSIRVPDGKPHAGEMAMDARAVELINAAWSRFGGKEPSSSGSNSAAARLAKARAEVGVKESPASTNNQKYGAWYGMNGVPWCAIFVTWCDQLSARPSRSLAKGTLYSYVPYIVSDAQLGKNGLSIVSTPKPGDLVCFDWDRDSVWDHIGLVSVAPDASGNFTSVEGNTSTSNQSNGGQVMERSRNRNSQGTVFVRVAEP
jgi:CHAP domain